MCAASARRAYGIDSDDCASPPDAKPHRTSRRDIAERVTDNDLANAIRVLAMDAVEAAKSGHPGMPMGMAEIAVALWTRHLKHNPANPRWPDRDRFVLSNGHGSMLQYALLHLTGYDLPLDELKRFRQLHSKTPGHPELGVTPGVETTTGPLGQGLANGVGMAIAEKLLAATFNRDGHTIVDHRTWVFAGDGCLMEGISHEACSLAGTLGLSKLAVVYDDNGISIDGEVEGWFTDDTGQALRGVRLERDPRRRRARRRGHAPRASGGGAGSGAPDADLSRRRSSARARRPSAAPPTCHGAALGEKEVAATREALGWPHAAFVIPHAIKDGVGCARTAARRAKRSGASASRLTVRRIRILRRSSSAASTGRLAGRLRGDRRGVRRRAEREGRDRRHAQGFAAGDRGLRETPAGDDRRLGGPDRLGVHELVGQQGALARRGRATTSTTACASSRCSRSATASRCTAASCPTRARSSCSPTTAATRSAWRR